MQVAEAELRAFVQAGRETALADAEITAERVCELAHTSDAAALAVIDRSGRELGRLCALLVDLLNPDVIVLGTIGSAHFDLFEPRIRTVLEREALQRAAEHVVIRPSGLSERGDQTALAIARKVAEQ